jgi:hypothetical protein
MEVVIGPTLAGLPSISVPVGFNSDGLPMGLQIIGPAQADHAVLQLAYAHEQLTRWVSGARHRACRPHEHWQARFLLGYADHPATRRSNPRASRQTAAACVRWSGRWPLSTCWRSTRRWAWKNCIT